MPSDRSRLADQPRNLYAGVVAQQGRVLLDRDVNALQEILFNRTAREVCDIVGPCGTPDDGFRISAPNPQPSPGFWSPPEPANASPPQTPGGGGDFLINAGSMYLGGHRVEFPPTQNGTPVSYSYLDQPDWAIPDPLPGTFEQELVYLDVELQEISAVEDPDLLEVALGGPDTTQRLRFIPRVKRLAVSSTQCASAWATTLERWTRQGYRFDPATMRLSPALRLKVDFTQDASTGNACDPVASGGYLGADNQLIRVQVVVTSQEQALVWGYDDASFLYRASISADGTTLTLASAPPDAAHTPQKGQVVEILGTGSVIAVEPDETDPTGIRQIVRVAAEARGEFHELAQTYGPTTQGDPTSYIVLTAPISSQIRNSGLPVFLRVWQAALPLKLQSPIALEDSATGLSTGIQVTLAGALPVNGAYWLIAARPATPQAVYPEDLLTAPQYADGPFRLVCPLAVLDWSVDNGPGISDCRNTFDNLVDLTRRKPGCCTVSISPTDLSGTSLQELIDKAVAKADIVTVCLGAGSYALDAPLQLSFAHTGLKLESCGGPATLLVSDANATSAFADGLVVLAGAANVTLTGLSLQVPPTPATTALTQLLVSGLANADAQAEALSLLVNPQASFGIRAFEAPGLTVDRCNINFVAQPANQTSDLLGAAIFLQGNCSGLQVKDCTFGSSVAPTYNAIANLANYGDFALKPFQLAASQLPGAGSESAAADAPPTSAAPAPGAVATPAPPVATPAPPVATPGPVATPAPVTTPTSPVTVPAPAAPGSVAGLDLGQILAAQSFAAILANRAGQTFAARRIPICATAGILALPVANQIPPTPPVAAGMIFVRAVTPCTLGIAEIRGNQVTNLTFGTLLIADATLLRVQDNTVSAGVAGLWMSSTTTVTPEGQNATGLGYANTVGNFEEVRLLTAFSSQIGPPAGGPPATVPVAGAAHPLVLASGNDVSTGSTAGLPGRCSLLIWLGGSTSKDISTLVSANQLSNDDSTTPTALIVLSQAQACALNGNIILNSAQTPAGLLGPNLWVLMDNELKMAEPFAAAGNVLRGVSNLSQFQRPGAASRTGWSGYNADPT